jgi:DnaK suppressor protein
MAATLSRVGRHVTDLELAEPDVAVLRLRAERAALMARLEDLGQDMAAFFEASRNSNADDEHDPEGQTIAFERAQLAAVTAGVREHLGEVDAALERLAAGTYGVCEVCRDRVGTGRLEARPTTRTCVEHAPSRGR